MTSERMSPVDTAWLHMDDPDNPADIVTLLTFDEPLSYDRLKQRVTEVDGHPAWEDYPEFHIDRHVMRYDIDAPLTDESVTRAVTDLANQRLSPNRPLWAVHLVGGTDGGSVPRSTMCS